MPDGYGPALAVEILHRGNAKIPVEALKVDLPAVWFCLQQGVFAGASPQPVMPLAAVLLTRT